jgi:coenzyme F420 hydrogenase subunit beta
MRAGYIRLTPVQPEVLEQSQKELQMKRGAIWGRILALRALRVPAPRLQGFHLFENWLEIPFAHKARSVVGTVRRVIARRYRKPLSTDTSEAKGKSE